MGVGSNPKGAQLVLLYFSKIHLFLMYLYKKNEMSVEISVEVCLIKYLQASVSFESDSPCTGCLKKTWTFFENAIIPSFIKETFPNFLRS